MHRQIFVSYSREDERFVRQILIENLRHEFDLWIDTDRLQAGDDWRRGIDEAIRESFAVLVVISPESSRSPYVTYEWSYALGLGLPVIPIILTETKELHPRLSPQQWLSYPKLYNDLWKKLVPLLKEKQAQFQSPGATETALRLMEHGQQKHELNDLENALASLAKAANFAGPTLLDDIHHEMGIICMKLNRYDEAETHLIKALQFNERHARAMEVLGTLYRMLADDEKTDLVRQERLLSDAQARFLAALEIQPDLLDHRDGESVWGSLGGIYKRLNQFDKAIEAYKKATQIKRSSYPFNNLGLLYMEKGDIGAMRKNFRLVELYAQAKIRLDPGDVWAHNDLLVAQIVWGEVDQARETLALMEIVSLPYAIKSLLRTLSTLAQLENIPDESKDFIDEAIQTLNGYLA